MISYHCCHKVPQTQSLYQQIHYPAVLEVTSLKQVIGVAFLQEALGDVLFTFQPRLTRPLGSWSLPLPSRSAAQHPLSSLTCLHKNEIPMKTPFRLPWPQDHLGQFLHVKVLNCICKLTYLWVQGLEHGQLQREDYLAYTRQNDEKRLVGWYRIGNINVLTYAVLLHTTTVTTYVNIVVISVRDKDNMEQKQLFKSGNKLPKLKKSWTRRYKWLDEFRQG